MRELLAAACGACCSSCPKSATSGRCSLEARPDCAILLCCIERQVEHCGECVDFPCAALQSFVPEDRPEYAPGYHIENLRRRSWIGTRAWLWEQGVRAPEDQGEPYVRAAWM